MNTIGELFVSLGVKGSDKTIGALTGVKKGLGEAASMSLEAKAGIIAAMYALERLFSTSGQAGTSLTNFNATLGLSAKTLQQYQYAARQMGVANQEVEGSFKSLQTAMTKTLMGEGAPKGMQRLAQITGDFKPGDLLKFQQNPEQLMQRLQDYAQKEKNLGLRNETLKSFGLGDGMIAAMSRNAFNPGALAKAPTYSDKEIGALDRANIAWSNLGTKIQMAAGQFNAKHGGQLVGDISKVADQVFRLIEAFTVLAEKLKVFTVIGKVFEGWAMIFDGLTEGVKNVTEAGTDGGKWKELLGGVATGATNVLEGINSAGRNPVAPSVDPSKFVGPKQQNNNVKLDLHFQHPGTNHQKTGESVKKAIQDSYRQMATQGQGS